MQRTKISPELAYLIEAAVSPSGNRPFEIGHNPFDPAKFAALAKWHQVRPLAFEYVQEQGLALPENVLKMLRDFTLGQAVTNMAFLGICVRLYNRLVENQVRVFPMKGALWAWMLYDKPILREFGDIDYFVGKEDVSQSLDILLGEGFAADSYRFYLLKHKAVADDYLDTDYQLPLTPLREHALQSLEIQWNCTYPRYCYNFTWNELAGDLVEFNMMGKPVLVPGMEIQLIMMVIHHGGVEQWDKLKYMADLVRLLDKSAGSMDWEFINRVTRAKGFNKLLLESLGAAGYLSGRDYLAYAGAGRSYPSQRFWKDMLNHWENERPSLKTKTWRIFLYNIKYRDKWSDKLSLVAAHLGYLTHWKLLWHKISWYRSGPSGEADRDRAVNAVSGREDV
ncbi:nucleotidyltransferase domain-containing protein [Dyadobacter sp. OTU695]|uniref:nucleotidyltransferase domain-containing protein n=1 Tax=Dyadobacter sp. OTU695 TaxID=3043860 RepID=UPI00313C318D